MTHHCQHCQDNGAHVCNERECSHADPRQPWEAQTARMPCRPCWVRLGGQPRPALIAPIVPDTLLVGPRAIPCEHMRGPTGETATCSSCKGKVSMKVHGCVRHAKCVRGKDLPGTHGCLECPDYHAPEIVPEAGRVRNLLFHLYPLREGQRWRWHVEQLRKHVGSFNGKRICAVCEDAATAPRAEVEAALRPLFSEILWFTNDPHRREVLTFEALFSRVESYDPGEVTLYAHSKGGSRHRQSVVQRWTELLYAVLMERHGEAMRALRHFPLAGAFKKLGAGWTKEESSSQWHYSGSWFWLRNRDLFLRNWRRIDQFWGGIEPYPSLHFGIGESACLFFEGHVGQMNLYDAGFWARTVEPAWQAYLERLQVPPGIKLEIGGGKKPRGGEWVDLDRETGFDLETDRFPFEDETVGEVYSSHTFEHVRNLHHLLHEVVRVCKPGARVEIRVPHWLSPMALCHDHEQVIPPEQVNHWCSDYSPLLAYWWTGSSRRLRHRSTQQIPATAIHDARRVFPHLSDEQIMQYVPGAAHEVVYVLEVVSNP